MIICEGHRFAEARVCSEFRHVDSCVFSDKEAIKESTWRTLLDIEEMYRGNDMGLTLEEFAIRLGYAERAT